MVPHYCKEMDPFILTETVLIENGNIQKSD